MGLIIIIGLNWSKICVLGWSLLSGKGTRIYIYISIINIWFIGSKINKIIIIKLKIFVKSINELLIYWKPIYCDPISLFKGCLLILKMDLKIS